MAKKHRVAVPAVQVAHLKPYEDVFRDRLAELPLDKLLIYLIDTVDAKALPYLAEQFNVLGNRGWRWATTESKQRALLKKAIYLHRIEGTEAAITEALQIIGIENAEVLHPIPGNYYNGQWSHNGTITYGGAYHWACFKVLVDYLDLVALPPETLEIAVELINEWKNVRSKLIGVEVAANLEDFLLVSDSLEIEVTYDFNEKLGPNNYDGVITYDGSANHSGKYDDVEVVVDGPTMATIFKVNGTPAAGLKLDVDIVIDISYLGVELEFQLPDGTVDSRIAGAIESVTHNFTGTETQEFEMRVADAAAIKTITIGNSFPEIIEFVSQCAPGDIYCNSTPLSSVVNIGSILDGQDIFIDLSSNQLSTAAVNTILADIVAASGFVSGSSSIDLSLQTPPAPPSGAGITNKATISATWAAITTD